jgi:hypothetical protein
MKYKIDYSLPGKKKTELKLKHILKTLVTFQNTNQEVQLLDEEMLSKVIIEEGVKSFLTKNIIVENKHKLFKPYKDICSLISDLIKEYNPRFKFSHSLATTIIEISHSHQFHAHYLPSLTDIKYGDRKKLIDFLNHLLFSSLKK